MKYIAFTLLTLFFIFKSFGIGLPKCGVNDGGNYSTDSLFFHSPDSLHIDNDTFTLDIKPEYEFEWQGHYRKVTSIRVNLRIKNNSTFLLGIPGTSFNAYCKIYFTTGINDPIHDESYSIVTLAKDSTYEHGISIEKGTCCDLNFHIRYLLIKPTEKLNIKGGDVILYPKDFDITKELIEIEVGYLKLPSESHDNYLKIKYPAH